jgi:hypothetical protein
MTSPSASSPMTVGLHAIVEDRARRAADRLEGSDVWQRRTLCRSLWRTNRAKISREQPSTMEKPDDAFDSRLVDELDLEPGEVDLGLLAGRRLEARFVSCAAGGSDKRSRNAAAFSGVGPATSA